MMPISSTMCCFAGATCSFLRREGRGRGWGGGGRGGGRGGGGGCSSDPVPVPQAEIHIHQKPFSDVSVNSVQF